jgi:signal peptide peptidase SppA
MKPPHNYPHLATRLFNVPLAIAPGKIEIVMAALADRFGLARLLRADGEMLVFEGDPDPGDPSEPRPYQILEGIAIIPIQGTLVQRLGTLQPYSGMTGYDGLRANLALALADSTVRAIALDIDSPGGEVAGCFDLVDAIYAARSVKPLWAILSEGAYSAAYALASACDVITVPRTGGTGSIGVIVAHVDFSRALDEEGITVTLIASGERKGEGNEYEPLSKQARQQIQSDVDAVADIFFATVARNRALAASKIRAAQGATFLGGQGVEFGLADAVMSPDEALQALYLELGG